MFPVSLMRDAKRLLKACEVKGVMLSTAESCTGGLIAALLTAIPGSSSVVERGFVTYSNQAKQEMLGVKPALIARHGAVSEQVAQAMAEGALKKSKSQLSVSVTGIAGPGGGTADKKVGRVYIGLARKGAKTRVRQFQFRGSRDVVRERSVKEALKLALSSF